MVLGNLATRSKAIPFRANWYDENNSIGNAFPLVGVIPSRSDIYELSIGTSGAIRLAVPASGSLVETRLTLQAVNPSASTAIRLGIGRFAADGLTAISSYSPDEITAMHRKLNGTDSPLVFSAGASILIDNMDLLKAIPKEGQANYSRDGFVLYIEIVSTDVTGFTLRSFKVSGSVLMGVL